ncbi:MAG TPA: L,D-transpeptidase [Candidatus Binataceae bacterium]|nr:L,D-transpeptidase [Candidatus Binataceae bacterium]
MTAAAAFLILLIVFFSGCQKSCNRPAPTPPQLPTASATVTATSTATPAPTPIPYAQRNFPCLSNIIVGKQFDYSPDETEEVHLISAKLGIDSSLIAHANHISRFSNIEPGRSLRIDNEHIAACDITNGILINLPQRMLFYYQEGKLITCYPVAIGKPDWKTPTGSFSILTKSKNPTWVVPKNIREEMEDEGKEVLTRVAPGPGNPLGNYWMGTSIPGIGIHATNVPASIYSYHTHGCVRLEPENAKDLFGRISKGVTGMIVYEPITFAKLDDGRVFIEVDRDIYDEGGATIDDAKHLANSLRLSDLIDWSGAAAVVSSHDGIAHDVSAKK